MNEQTLGDAFKKIYNPSQPQSFMKHEIEIRDRWDTPNKQHIIERLEHIAKYGGSQMELDRLEKQLKGMIYE